jgi:hypothetical protein
MSLALLIISNHNAVERLVAHRRESILPSDLRRSLNLPQNFLIISHFIYETASSLDEVLSHIDRLCSEKITGIAILADQQIQPVLSAVSTIFFISFVNFPAEIDSPQNFLMPLIANKLRKFRILQSRFADRKYQNVIRLPLRNFHASDLHRLTSTCYNPLSNKQFEPDLDRVLSELRKRRRPKKYGTHSRNYVVDDLNRHFELGLESTRKPIR